ncbi:MAG: 50S ribosomal protein L25 [Bacteriovoracales bacterium]
MKHYPLLATQSRPPKSKIKASTIRKQNKLPGVIYGIGMKSMPIQIEWKTWQNVAEKGEKIIDVKVDGGSKILVAISEIAREPITNKIVHISFHKLNEKQESTITVPIHLVGHVEKGVMAHIINEVEIKGKPQDLPGHLDIDISHLKEGDHLLISDIKVPNGVKILEEGEKVFAICQRPKKVEEPVKVVEVTPGEVPLVGAEAPAEATVIPLRQPSKKAS